jgi:hypothetical protein
MKKKLLTLFLISVFLLGSCRKNQQLTPPVADTQSAFPDNAHVIATADIANWFVKNPVGAYLTMDWSNAKQAVIGGVNVVTVPIAAITNAAPQQSNIKTQGLTTQSVNTAIAGFNPAHPPALYFFKVTGSTDSVKALLMNFLPDDPNKENGENKIWTGKLVEWNMQSDTARYQTLSKSYVKALGKFIIGQSNNTNATQIKTNTIWDWISDALTSIVNAVKDVLNAIGTFLNIPGDYGNGPSGSWCDFLWGGWCGGGGGGGGSGGGGGGYSGGPNFDAIYNLWLQ